jgi:hypothetical protein
VVSGGEFQFTVSPVSADIELEVVLDPVSDVPGSSIERRVDGSYVVTIPSVEADLSILINARSTPSANAELSASSARVWSSGSELHLLSTRVSEARIYSLSGILVQTIPLQPSLPSHLYLPHGIYVITLEDKSYKVFLR